MEPSTVADHEAHSPTAGGHGRVASLDLLRGLCAVAVAAYHGLSWIGLGTFHNLGLYGVYLFFLLSGASMSLAYAQRFRRGYPYTSYLALRYVRLAPLYGAVALYEILSWGLARYSPAAALGRWLLNRHSSSASPTRAGQRSRPAAGRSGSNSYSTSSSRSS